MEFVLLSKAQYETLKSDLEEVKLHLKKIAVPNEAFVNNKKFTKLMNISHRTAQVWRDEGKIGFSQEGKKIYYRLSDVEQFLNDHHHSPFAISKKIKQGLFF